MFIQCINREKEREKKITLMRAYDQRIKITVILVASLRDIARERKKRGRPIFLFIIP